MHEATSKKGSAQKGEYLLLMGASEKVTTLKGKNFIQAEQIHYFRVASFQKDDKNI